MNAPVRALLEDLEAQGIEIAAVGERLRCRPGSALTDELRERVKRLRPELVAVLAARQDEFSAAVLEAFDGVLEDGPTWRKIVPLEQVRAANCHGCRGRAWWRLRSNSIGLPGDWVCERCYPAPSDIGIDRSAPGEGTMA